MAMNRFWWTRTFVCISALGGLGAGLLVACTSQQRPRTAPVDAQPYADAMRQICDVDSLASIPVDADELERARQREDYMVENTKNPDAIFFATIFRTKTPAEKAAMLAREARDSGLAKCALADALGGGE